MSDENIYSKLVLLAIQINELIGQVILEERKENPNIEILNYLIKRIFRTAATIDVVKNWNRFENMEQIKAAITEQYMLYFYSFGEQLQPTIQIEKLHFD